MNLLKGIASKVKTHGKDFISNMVKILPGSNQVLLNTLLFLKELFDPENCGINFRRKIE